MKFKLLLLLLFVQYSYAQVKVLTLDKKTIPISIKYFGKLINAVRYTDIEGEHIVVATETGETKVNTVDADFRNADLYAYNYVVTGDQQKLSWQVHDFVRDCSVDIKANYVPNTFAVTDLDKNGKAEVWLMYNTACRGDVSPSNMKIIMYEGNKKYALRGTSKVKISDTEYYGGKYTFDEAFKNGPELFRAYAIQLWNKNLIEKW